MKKALNVDQVMMRMDLPCEVTPGSSLVEIIGNRRVFIENQMGVSSYSQCSITVKVHCGFICVTGEDLELQPMTKNHLVITGVIFAVSFANRG